MANMKREKFTPKAGEIYRNQGGGTFRCLRSGYSTGEATMQTVLESDVEPTCIYDSLADMHRYL